MIWLAIINFLLVLSVKLAYDINLYHSRKPVKHTIEAIAVIVTLIPAGFILYKECNAVWYFKLPVIILMLFFNFWNLFDGIYNGLRNYGWFFTGSDDADDAKLDNLLQAIPSWLHKGLKIGGSLITIIIYKEIF